jgi:hypothetical protein
VRHRIGGARSQQISRGEITSISSERRRPTKPLGGGERGHSSEYFAQGGIGEGHRSWPELSSDDGGDTVARGLGGQRGGRVRGWAGSVVRPRPEPGYLSRARWAGWASRPDGPAGQVGRIGLCQLNLIRISRLNSNTNSFMKSNQIQKFR